MAPSGQEASGSFEKLQEAPRNVMGLQLQALGVQARGLPGLLLTRLCLPGLGQEALSALEEHLTGLGSSAEREQRGGMGLRLPAVCIAQGPRAQSSQARVSGSGHRALARSLGSVPQNRLWSAMAGPPESLRTWPPGCGRSCEQGLRKQ